MVEVIGFHNPEEPYGFLSNWYLSEFVAGGVTFSSMEQYMMYEKAKLFGDEAAAKEINKSEDPGTIKALGRKVKNYNDVVWNGSRQVIIYDGLLEKFRQNEDLMEKLLATGDAVLAECAVQDRIWGIGRSMQDEKRLSISTWNGQNLLGFALMRVREQVK